MGTLIDQAFFDRLRILNEKFAVGVPDTLARLGRLRASFDPAAPDPQLVGEVQQVLHTVAGSAATFGFRSFGQQARALEQRMRVLTAFDVVAARDWNNWLASLDQFLDWASIDPKADYYDGGSLQS